MMMDYNLDELRFSWFKVKDVCAALPIATMLFSNHLKWIILARFIFLRSSKINYLIQKLYKVILIILN